MLHYINTVGTKNIYLQYIFHFMFLQLSLYVQTGKHQLGGPYITTTVCEGSC